MKIQLYTIRLLVAKSVLKKSDKALFPTQQQEAVNVLYKNKRTPQTALYGFNSRISLTPFVATLSSPDQE